ncbi:MAG: hypothetical protein WAV90_05715 [Gordonia amarae]
MGTYFEPVVELDDWLSPIRTRTGWSESLEATLAGHINIHDIRVRGTLAHIRATPRRVWWMSDYSEEWRELEEDIYAGSPERMLPLTGMPPGLETREVFPEWEQWLGVGTIPSDAPASAMDLPIVIDVDSAEFFDARDWDDYSYPLPVLACAYLTGHIADDPDWAPIARRWYGHRLQAHVAGSVSTSGLVKIEAPAGKRR